MEEPIAEGLEVYDGNLVPCVHHTGLQGSRGILFPDDEDRSVKMMADDLQLIAHGFRDGIDVVHHSDDDEEVIPSGNEVETGTGDLVDVGNIESRFFKDSHDRYHWIVPFHDTINHHQFLFICTAHCSTIRSMENAPVTGISIFPSPESVLSPHGYEHAAHLPLVSDLPLFILSGKREGLQVQVPHRNDEDPPVGKLPEEGRRHSG